MFAAASGGQKTVIEKQKKMENETNLQKVKVMIKYFVADQIFNYVSNLISGQVLTAIYVFYNSILMQNIMFDKYGLLLD